MSNIKSVIEIGEDETYDLEIDHDDHQFYLANGVLTSNSHATAYAIDSYWCAFLLTHHEESWLAAYMESMQGNPDNKAEATSEIKAMGYTIVPIDINEATTGWAILPGKRFMPSFLSCKGIGRAAVEEIVENRPYKSIEDVLWNEDGSWRHGKFNRRALDALIKIGGFGSLDCVGEGKMFKNPHHMWKVIIEHNNDIKKRSKKDPFMGKKRFYELVSELSDTPDWTLKDRAEFMVELYGAVDVMNLNDDIRAKIEHLTKRDIASIDEHEGLGIYWFVVNKSFMKKTKNNKTYAVIEAMGPTGRSHRLNVWGAKGTYEQYAMYVGEIDANDFGKSTTAWKIRALV